jgi:hypothetical protein
MRSPGATEPGLREGPKMIAPNFATASASATATTNTLVPLAPLDARHYRSVAYTVKGAVNDIRFAVYGANASDYSDETVVQAEADVLVGAVGTYAVANAPFAYYRVKVKSKVNDTHGTATPVGYAKAG